MLLLNRYMLKEDERELKEIEQDLALALGVPFVRCGYDAVNSHKYRDAEELKYRMKNCNNINDTYNLDYVINYELYRTKEDYDNHNGGFDGEVHELHYFKGNGNYIIIVNE